MPAVGDAVQRERCLRHGLTVDLQNAVGHVLRILRGDGDIVAQCFQNAAGAMQHALRRILGTERPLRARALGIPADPALLTVRAQVHGKTGVAPGQLLRPVCR